MGTHPFWPHLLGTEQTYPSSTEGTVPKTPSYLKGSTKVFMKILVALKNPKDAHSEFSLHCVGLCTNVVRITFNSILEEEVHKGQCGPGLGPSRVPGA